MKNTIKYIAPVLLAAAVGSVNAATIVTGSSFTGITAETSLDNSGTFVEAVNYGGGDTTINGITFTGQATNAGTGTLSGTATVTSSTAYWSADAGTVGAFDSLMDGHVASDTNSGGWTIALSLTGLTIGQEYTIQLLSGDASLKHTTSFYNSVTLGAKTEKLINQQPIGATTSDLGGIFTATFTTDDGNAFFTFERSSSDNQPVLSGYVLTTAVPEPSSAALLGLGGLALILRRRK